MPLSAANVKHSMHGRRIIAETPPETPSTLEDELKGPANMSSRWTICATRDTGAIGIILSWIIASDKIPPAETQKQAAGKPLQLTATDTTAPGGAFCRDFGIELPQLIF